MNKIDLNTIILWKGWIETALQVLIITFMAIPGPHPEDWLQKILDFLKKFSLKPKK